ncbi:MAG TPA: CHAT domain-containing protein [Bacillota bacterium]|nr:CHAT domain-containing protein [Bacillota bacterium]
MVKGFNVPGEANNYENPSIAGVLRDWQPEADPNLISLEELKPLLDALQEPDPGVRSTALKAIVLLPLSQEAWEYVSGYVLNLLTPGAMGGARPVSEEETILRDQLFDSAIYVPTNKVRQLLRKIIVQGSPDDRSRAVNVLAKIGDPAAGPALLERLRSKYEDTRIYAAKEFSLLKIPTDPKIIRKMRAELKSAAPLDKTSEFIINPPFKELRYQSIKDSSEPVRFWLSLMLAHYGDGGPLLRILEEIRRHGSIFPGAPPSSTELIRRGPFPEKVKGSLRRKFLEPKPDNDTLLVYEIVKTLFESSIDEKAQPLPLSTIEETAIGEKLAQQYLKEKFVEDWTAWLQDNREALSHVSGDTAGKLIEDFFARMARMIETPDARPNSFINAMVAQLAGNTVVEFIGSLKSQPVLNFKNVMNSYLILRRDHDPASQLEWTVSRIGVQKAFQELTGFITSTVKAERLAGLSLLAGAAAFTQNHTFPIYGAGPGGPDEMLPPVDLIPDQMEEATYQDSKQCESCAPSNQESEPIYHEQKKMSPPRDRDMAVNPRYQEEMMKETEPPAFPEIMMDWSPRGKEESSAPLVHAKPPSTNLDNLIPQSAYALLDCPEVVVSESEFKLVVGLSEKPSEGVVGDQLVFPDYIRGPFDLRVQLTTEGMKLGPGESWDNVLHVDGTNPYPSITLHLTTASQQEKVSSNYIKALYSIEGQMIGFAFRSIAVVQTANLISTIPVTGQERGQDLNIPVNTIAPDLTLSITKGVMESQFKFTLTAPPDIPLPGEIAPVTIGKAEEFARLLIESVKKNEGTPDIYDHLLGKAEDIANKLPSVFWDLLYMVAEKRAPHRERPLMIQILSEEPYVPWELALVDPPINPDAPPFLAAQACVGRWVLGQRRIKPNPPTEVPVKSVALVSGIYNAPNWRRLVEAENEAKEIKRFCEEKQAIAIPVNADSSQVREIINGRPEADLLHFAVHGQYDPLSTENGLMLVDRKVLDPEKVKLSNLKGKRPFVFLNACQVGSGNNVLGDYAGMAEAFLSAGASGVVAPLWSIDDKTAKEIALEFYQQVFAGLPVSEMLRLLKAKFKNSTETVSATFLAYQFFGHPALILKQMESDVS